MKIIYERRDNHGQLFLLTKDAELKGRLELSCFIEEEFPGFVLVNFHRIQDDLGEFYYFCRAVWGMKDD